MKKKITVRLAAAAAALLLLTGCAGKSADVSAPGEALSGRLAAALETRRAEAEEARRAALEGLAALEAGRRGAVKKDLSRMREAAESRFRYEHVYLGEEGTAGRLSIPSVSINVAVNLPGEDAQLTADAADSACWMEYDYGWNPVIGDHVNQEFSSLSQVKPGDLCTIVKDGRAYEYRCLNVGYGSNIETDVLDGAGRSIFRREEDRLFLYTCAAGWRYVFISEWQCESPGTLHQVTPPVLIHQIVFQDEEPR